MAKSSNNGSGGGRVRFIYAEVEGDNQTVQDALRAITNAMPRQAAPLKVVKALPSKPSETPLFDALADVEDEDVVEGEFDNVIPEAKNGAPRKTPTMSMVKELNLRANGVQSLRDFYAEKAPKSDQSRIAVFVYYLRRILKIDGVTPNHVYTCFRDVGKTGPKDLPQAIRNTANRKAWVDSSNSEALEITDHGVNHVEKDLNGSANERA